MEGYTGLSSRLSKAFLPSRVSSPVAFLQGRGQWGGEERLAGVPLTLRRRDVRGPSLGGRVFARGR